MFEIQQIIKYNPSQYTIVNYYYVYHFLLRNRMFYNSKISQSVTVALSLSLIFEKYFVIF
jgi:hypothetical protein